MSVPAQVRKQIEAVDKLYEDLNAAQTQGGQPEGVAADGVQPPADNGNEPTPASRAVEQSESTKAENTFEHKYKTLQGMYNAEVPQLHAVNRELTQRVQQLEQLIASMNSPAPSAQQPSQKLLTQEDEEAYGDSITVMRKVFREEMASKDAEITELKQMLRQMQTSVVPKVHELSQSVAVGNDQRFWADLQALVPDWQAINADAEFHSWLLAIDPLTGVSRQTYLETAQRSLDARRVAAFFTLWKDQTGKRVAQDPQPTPVPSQLTAQIAPGKGRGGAVPAQTPTKTYSRADIQKFFSDVHKGLYRGREQERHTIESDIFAAQREGRITD